MDEPAQGADRPGSRRNAKRRRWVVALCGLAGLALVVWLLARYVAVPWAVRSALRGAGLEPGVFDIESVGPGRMRLTGVTVGPPAEVTAGAGTVEGLTAGPWLRAGVIEIGYSLGDLMSGRVREIGVRDGVWTVRVRDGAVDWGLVPPKSAGPVSIELPFERVSVSRFVVRIETKENAYEIATDLTLESTPAGIGASINLAGLGSRVDLVVKAAADAGVLNVEVESAGPAELKVESSGVSATLGSIAGRLRLTQDASGASVPEGTLAVRGGTVRAGDITLSDLELDARVRSAGEMELSRLSAVVGDVGVVSVEPFTFRLDDPTVRTRISVSNLNLAEWVPLVSGQHATAQGRISGTVEIGLDVARGEVTVTELAGGLAADPDGFIQVTDALAMGELLERQNPKFATDQVMKPLKEKIVAALQDFAFKTLRVDLSRQGDRTGALVYISGFGRHGEDPQGINLTLDVQAQDTILNLASRMEALAKVKSAARGALERFFETPAPPDRQTP